MLDYFYEGFGDRLFSEIKKLAPKDMKIKITAPQERMYTTWIGYVSLVSMMLSFIVSIEMFFFIQWFHSGLIGYLQTNVGVEGRIRRKGS